MAEDIFQAIIRDHTGIRSLMKVVDRCKMNDDARRAKAFAELAKALVAHAKAEERSLYDSMLGESPTHDEIQHIAEHDAIVDLIRLLGRKTVPSTRWPDTFDELAVLVNRHLDEEEHELFPVGQLMLSDEQKARLGELYRQAKADEDGKDRGDLLVL